MTFVNPASVQRAQSATNSALMKIARNYVFHVMPKVKGYLGTVDALTIASILIGQSNAALDGGVVEIGVFFGRSFYLMAMLLQGHEKALAVDLFNIQPSSGQDSGQLKSFLEIAGRMGITVERDMVWVGNAHGLTAETILAKTGPVRFFSVDGGHLLDEARHDTNLAADAIADHGVICFDDFCNPEWPEVSLAIFDFLRARGGEFVPFLISQKKLFVCKLQYRQFYGHLIADAPALHKIKKPDIALLNQRTMVARSSPLEYLRCEAFARSGLGPLNRLVYSPRGQV